MDDMKSKFFKASSSVQEGLKKGKEKFETSQELNELKLEVRDLQQNRTNHIIELGEAAYFKFRMGKETSVPFVEEIKVLDKKIFDLLKVIEKKTRIESAKTCECGNPLTLKDKFCKECGKRVEVIEKVDIKDMVECSDCKTINLNNNKYCNCCGYRLV
ncbi:zinc ribbon domain-containing protein [Tissierella creatinophila]|uniref:Double zinc ribbon n=1 Tax=Tissierella creatinophila DSM 6911 TaxID=1123403 RepID=A0A1U7M5M1_TISCR|nr:zinc ribbon domain-containing protein [Tissierella creatinophila]OLS02613.1 double zinc ribbon [Tissierella creatinophila DSM 6911]